MCRMNHGTRYIPELDGLRAIAVWAVLIHHLFYGWPVDPHAFDSIPSGVQKILDHGWLGVDLFFVLSGFLITGILLDSRNTPRYFQVFYGRRALRILPLYFAVVLVFALFYQRNTDYFVLSTGFAANFARLFEVPVPHGPGVFWSLAVEEHFYIVWPLIVFFLGRRSLVAVAVFIVATTPILRGMAVANGMSPNSVYLYSWFRFDGMALGALMAVWVRSRHSNNVNSYWLAASLMSLSLAITVVGAPYGLMREGVLGSAFRYTQVQLFFAAFLLLAVVWQGRRSTGILRWSFFRFTAELSFCLYLVHLAVGDGVNFFIHRWGGGYDLGGLDVVLLRGGLMLLFSFAIALFTRRYLELPFLGLKRYF
jgi:peptidoglycan/LPS O-acetylase OafA/YrhL